jgi:hypothetical protein
MVIEKGVEMRKVCRNITRVLKVIETIYKDTGQELVITGTKWGHDHSRFAHESGRAIDIALPVYLHLRTVNKLRLCLGVNFIVRVNQNHLCIEFCPMPILKS